MARTATPVGGSDEDFAADDQDGRFLGLDMTGPFNFTAQCPALSVPAGWSDDGLPVGLQIVGRRFDDAGVLAIGEALERIRPWQDRRPPL